MGLSASKRVQTSLTGSTHFDSACDSAYDHCLSLSQHAFQGVLPYQLLTASNHLHQTLLSQSHHRPQSLILEWVPDPPTRAQVDSALKKVTHHHQQQQQHRPEAESLDVLGPALFKQWAVALYSDAVVGNAAKALLSRVPIGIAGITGVGIVTRSGKDLIGTAIAVYALGVATSIYLSLSG